MLKPKIIVQICCVMKLDDKKKGIRMACQIFLFFIAKVLSKKNALRLNSPPSQEFLSQVAQ